MLRKVLLLLGLAAAVSAAEVRWQTLDDAAFAEAKRRAVPLYVFVVHPTSEPSRDTLRQTLAVPETATLVAERFVPVLVDADATPAAAALAREAAGVLKQATGWPIHFWLTPEGQPLEVAVNLPATEEWGRKSVVQTLRRVDDEWRQDPAAARTRAAEAQAALEAARASRQPDATELPSRLAAYAADWAARHDGRAGFGGPLAQPEPEVIRLLLASPAHRDVALRALRATVDSALADGRDGGFFRACEDPEWRTPYRQKLLLDQLRLTEVLLDAAAHDPDARWSQQARATLDYVLRRLAAPAGGFLTGEEGDPAKPFGLAPAGAQGRAAAVLARAAQELREPRYRAAAEATLDFVEKKLAGRRFPSGGEPSASDWAGMLRAQRALGRESAASLRALRALLQPATHRFVATSGSEVSALPEPLAVEALALEAAPEIAAFREAVLASSFTPEAALALARRD